MEHRSAHSDSLAGQRHAIHNPCVQGPETEPGQVGLASISSRQSEFCLHHVTIVQSSSQGPPSSHKEILSRHPPLSPSPSATILHQRLHPSFAFNGKQVVVNTAYTDASLSGRDSTTTKFTGRANGRRPLKIAT